MQHLEYCVISPSGWHEDSVRTFCVSLPRPLPAGSPLIDAETGEALGEIVKAWPTIGASTPARIRIEPRHASRAVALRPDLLAHRQNIAIDAAGRLLLVGRIDRKELPAAAPLRRDPPWPSPLRIVS